MLSTDRLYLRVINDIKESPFSGSIKGYLAELANIYRIGEMESIPLKEVPALSPFLGEKVRRTYDFRDYKEICVECGADSETIICDVTCMRNREKRLRSIGMCTKAFISTAMCKGRIIDGMCRLHR